MPRKQPNRLNGFEKLLLGIAFLFLSVTVLRTIQFEPFLRVQTAVQTFLTGNQSIEQAVQAVGSFTESDQLQAVFSDWFPTINPQENQPVMESSVPSETLAATAAGVFPTQEADAVYPISLSNTQPIENAVLTSSFGPRVHPVTGQQSSFHKGIDLAAEQGSPIRALANSTVRTAAQSDSYGNYLILQHTDGICALYAHCEQLLVKEGEHIQAGQTIATVGDTGTATGYHLHLELWYAGKLLNPEDYIAL